MSSRGYKFGAMSAVLGAVLLFAGTSLHPMQADPNDPVAAFSEYAADRHWVASHLTQLAGVALIVGALLVLANELESGGRAGLPCIAAGGAIASLMLTAVLQAVDGIALKVMVDAWAGAESSEKAGLFHAAFGVRQVEVGLASVTSMVFGLTVTLYGIALWNSGHYPRWAAVLALLGGIPTLVGGVLIAYTGFSSLAMTVYMPAGLLILVWVISVGALMWRRGTTVGGGLVTA
ncbi:hypothetical protein MYX75_12120 [Acidobacteria bacterium AH-259-A15]|nr:hypothetical protein [Acidobacteria bacterium AH-259-A15]